MVLARWRTLRIPAAACRAQKTASAAASALVADRLWSASRAMRGFALTRLRACLRVCGRCAHHRAVRTPRAHPAASRTRPIRGRGNG